MQITDPPRFLLDENLSPEIATGLQRRDHSVDVLGIPGPGAPIKGTRDPDILLFCEAEHRALITKNRASMPDHLAAFASEGRHHWGIFYLRKSLTIGQAFEVLLLIWGATNASEHIDEVQWLP